MHEWNFALFYLGYYMCLVCLLFLKEDGILKNNLKKKTNIPVLYLVQGEN